MGSIAFHRTYDFLVENLVFVEVSTFVRTDDPDRTFPLVFFEQIFKIDIECVCEGKKGVDCRRNLVAFDLRDEAFAYTRRLGDDLEGISLAFPHRAEFFPEAEGCFIR